MKRDNPAKAIIVVVTVWTLLLAGTTIGAADTSLARATAVYGVISTDPVYLWMAQDKGFFKKNGLNIDLTHIPTNQAVQALV